MRSESFRKGVKDGIPIGLGYFSLRHCFLQEEMQGGRREAVGAK